MKKLSITVFILVFCQVSAYSQSCLPEGIHFSTQEQIDQFQVNYPGCSQIEGDVLINSGGGDITNLNGLSVLNSIEGNLGVTYNSSLNCLTGLNNLISIGGYLSINCNDILGSLTGLESLASIGDVLSVTNNTSLTTLTGLDNIDAASITEIYIQNNSSLFDCEVQSVCNYLASPNGSINISGNAGGCNNPHQAADACGIPFSCMPYGNYYFICQSDIDSFQMNYPGCVELQGNVIIDCFGSDITSLNGLSVINSIDGDLVIQNNSALTSLQGLENLTSITGNLTIYINALADLTGLNELTSIGGNISITQNNQLTGLSGLSNLSSVGGDLIIAGNNSLTNLSMLTNLNFIGGNLDINSNGSLQGIWGMYSLTSIGGFLNITANPLTSLTGLNNLTSIGEGLSILDNDYLTSLRALNSLTSVQGEMNIGGNDALFSLAGLENLTSIDGNLEIYSNNSITNVLSLDNIDEASIKNLTIRDNISLSNCQAQSLCDYLASPNGVVNIYHNSEGCNNPPEIASDCGVTIPCLPFGNYYFFTQEEIDSFQVNYPDCMDLEGEVIISGNGITNLQGLDLVTSVSGNLTINGNEILTDLSGLNSLTSIEGSLTIFDNDSLSSLTGLNSLTDIAGDFSIYANFNLIGLTGLNSISFIGGHLTIFYNDSLTTLSGMDSLNLITGNLEIYENDNLINISGLNSLTSINGSLEIHENDNLTSISGLNNLESVGGDLTFYYNNNLTTLSGLNSLTSIAGSLRVFGNGNLVDLYGLNSLTSIGIDLIIGIKGRYGECYGNPNLTDLAGLTGLNSIGGRLGIACNDALTSLAGLDNIDAASINMLVIKDNPILSSCAVQSVCDYLTSPNANIFIEGNAPGCNSPEEVDSACVYLSNEEVNREPDISIYPNPASGGIIITFNLEEEAIVNLRVMNNIGQVVSVILDENMSQGIHQVSWNTEGLQRGIYFLELKANGGRKASVKLIKC